ncbi:MAG: hypothetical protein ALECFALPRED_004015 [Alectoria fallacina]|uniref:EthD domain-containing protein n=1 Tax=Alectoria fallacina TaxID=1903189 RepID=A0A8H3I589_9LECA|nr:MAG: hypothetical protein ALECFALPRED_004015 [Alectoria fallacina]
MDGGTQTYSDPERDEVLCSIGSNNAMRDIELNADRIEMTIPLERLFNFLTPYLPKEVHSQVGDLVVDVVLQSNREPIRHGALPVLKNLADSLSKEITFASVASDALELLSSSLAGQRDRIFAILKQTWDRLFLTTTPYLLFPLSVRNTLDEMNRHLNRGWVVDDHDLTIEFYFRSFEEMNKVTNDPEFQKLQQEEEPYVNRTHTVVSLGWVESYVQNGEVVNVKDGKSTYGTFEESSDLSNALPKQPAATSGA